MRYKVTILTAVVVALCSSSARAQLAPGLLLGSGFVAVAQSDFDPGLHLFAAIDVQRTRRLRPRAEVILEQTRRRDILAIGSVAYGPVNKRIAPYVVLGSGAYFDNGVQPMIVAGAGVAFAAAWRAPLALEARAASGPETHVLLTLAVRP